MLPPDIDRFLTAFREGLLEALSKNLVALYVGGSLLTDDFAPASSDIDFLAITVEPLQQIEVDRLAALHRHLASLSAWGNRLEGEYAVQTDLRPWGIDGSGAAIEPGQLLRVTRLTDVTAENLLAIREYGLAMHGPPPDTVIPAVDRLAFEAALREYLGELLQRPDQALTPPARDLADCLLNSARCLYGLQVIRPCSKREAAGWLAEEMPHLAPALSLALSIRAGESALEAGAVLLAALEDLEEAVERGLLGAGGWNRGVDG